MPLLDPDRQYVLGGESSGSREEQPSGNRPPKTIHLKFPASILDVLVASRENSSSVHLSSVDSGEALLYVDGEYYPLQVTPETTVTQVYAISSGKSALHMVGNVSSRFSFASSEINPISNATMRLKERREAEEARKTEHRTVMLDAVPSSSRGRTTPSTSSLKLRPKGVVAAQSPLIRSRAGTPNGNFSLPGSPSLGPTQKSAKTPPSTSSALQHIQGVMPKSSPLSGTALVDNSEASSAPSLRRRLVQLLAVGPASRRDIVQQLHLPEPSVLAVLKQVAQSAPEALQPPSDASKRYNGPVNRRKSVQTQPSVPLAGQIADRGASTVFLLKDESYPEVWIGGWAEYDDKMRQAVSQNTEAALKRLGWKPQEERWKCILPERSSGSAPFQKEVASRTEDETAFGNQENSNGSSSIDSPTKADLAEPSRGRGTIKKNSTMDRLKKAAKGKGSTRSSSPATQKASPTKRVREEEASKEEDRPKRTHIEAPELPVKGKSTSSKVTQAANAPLNQDEKTARKHHTEKSKQPQKRVNKGSARKEIEYTDSSDNDEMEIPLKNSHARENSSSALSERNTLTSRLRNSVGSDEKGRTRHGVGAGAAFTSEPWLDVRSNGDWRKLAERFTRVYGEYSKALSRLHQEQETIRTELEVARSEKTKIEDAKENRGGEMVTLQVDEELEEGEASPTAGSATAKDVVPTASFAEVTWRPKTMENLKITTMRPISIDELKTHVRSMQEMEAQLNRMRITLQTSKKRLQEVA